MSASFDGLRFSHWQTESRADGIVVLSLDRQGAPVNALSQDVLIELGNVLERLAIEDPASFVRAAVALVPKDVNVDVRDVTYDEAVRMLLNGRSVADGDAGSAPNAVN